jgi:sulfur carrier protein ThiS
MIRVKIAASKQWKKLEFRSGMKVKDILKTLHFHPASVAMMSLNGIPSDENAELKDGDELILVPAVGGG